MSKTFRALQEKSFRSVERFMGQLRLPFFAEKELSYEVIMFNSENHTFLCSFIPILPSLCPLHQEFEHLCVCALRSVHMYIFFLLITTCLLSSLVYVECSPFEGH